MQINKSRNETPVQVIARGQGSTTFYVLTYADGFVEHVRGATPEIVDVWRKTIARSTLDQRATNKINELQNAVEYFGTENKEFIDELFWDCFEERLLSATPQIAESDTREAFDLFVRCEDTIEQARDILRDLQDDRLSEYLQGHGLECRNWITRKWQILRNEMMSQSAKLKNARADLVHYLNAMAFDWPEDRNNKGTKIA